MSHKWITYFIHTVSENPEEVKEISYIEKFYQDNQSVTLDGSGSKDPDGNITSYSWTQTAGPPVTLNGADTMTASFTAPTLSNDTTLKTTTRKNGNNKILVVIFILFHEY